MQRLNRSMRMTSLALLAIALAVTNAPAWALRGVPFELWPGGAPGAIGAEQKDIPTLTPYLPSPSAATGAAMVVCPGGGYHALAMDHEGTQIAQWLSEQGIAAFILRYRHAPDYRHPIPLMDAQRAIRALRANAKHWNIDPDRIGIMGFSAGGHLASTAGTHFDPVQPDPDDPIDRVGSRPDLMVLCYPVVTMGEFTHAGSRRNLLGPDPSQEMIDLLSNEKQVTPRTPPTFMFHTLADPAVPSQNSLQFAAALKRAGVKHELHLYQEGRHGVGFALNDPILSSWRDRLAGWLARQGFRAMPVIPPAPLQPIPTRQQLQWQEAELIAFFHFGMNTFHDVEWGDGKEDPARFNPTRFDARQWTRAIKAAGFGYAILTAKHHDGFCLWPSKLTEHSVKNSPWRDGQGDVVREVAEACRQDGLRFAVYLSPWDRHEPRYADNADYDAYFRGQLTELLTQYGRVAEVWFDGAGGKGHVYDFPSYYDLVRRLQPDALIAISGPDIRWVGNESGVARETEWSVQPANERFHPGMSGKVWYPAECDTSIRPGWFWHADQDSKVKSLDRLIDIYYQSVGRNSALLLNIPPNDKGLLSDPDVERLRQFREVLDKTFGTDFALGRTASASNVRGGDAAYGAAKAVDGDKATYWTTNDDETTGWLEVDLGEPATFNVTRVEELIALGQRVEAYRIEAWSGGEWKTITRGTTIGHKKLDRFDPVTASKVRLVIEKSRACPVIRAFGLHRAPEL